MKAVAQAVAVGLSVLSVYASYRHVRPIGDPKPKSRTVAVQPEALLEGATPLISQNGSWSIVEFIDYDCAGSKSIDNALLNAVERSPVKADWYLRHLPRWDHPEARLLSGLIARTDSANRLEQHRASLGSQGKPARRSMLIMERQRVQSDSWSTRRISEAILASDARAARAAGVTSTPVVFVIDPAGKVTRCAAVADVAKLLSPRS